MSNSDRDSPHLFGFRSLNDPGPDSERGTPDPVKALPGDFADQPACGHHVEVALHSSAARAGLRLSHQGADQRPVQKTETSSPGARPDRSDKAVVALLSHCVTRSRSIRADSVACSTPRKNAANRAAPEPCLRRAVPLPKANGRNSAQRPRRAPAWRAAITPPSIFFVARSASAIVEQESGLRDRVQQVHSVKRCREIKDGVALEAEERREAIPTPSGPRLRKPQGVGGDARRSAWRNCRAGAGLLLQIA